MFEQILEKIKDPKMLIIVVAVVALIVLLLLTRKGSPTAATAVGSGA